VARVAELELRLEALTATLESLAAQNDALERELKILRDENALLKRGLFGRRSERLEPGQLDIFGDYAVEPLVEIPAAPPKPAPKTLGGHLQALRRAAREAEHVGHAGARGRARRAAGPDADAY